MLQIYNEIMLAIILTWIVLVMIIITGICISIIFSTPGKEVKND